MANIIEVVLRARDQMSGQLKGAEKNVGKFGASLKELALVAGGLTVVGMSMKKLFDLAGQQERAEHLLAAAMKQAGTYTAQAHRHNLDYAASLQKITTYGDEQIMVAQKMLTNFGVEGEMLDKLTMATLNLAAAKGFDLKSAADLVAKSVGSSTNALTRYGITIEGTVGSTERMQMAVENITRFFGGSAVAAADTYLGRMEQLDNIMHDVGEKFGDLMLPTVTKDMETLAIAVGGLNDAMAALDDITGTGWLRDAKDALIGFLNPLVQMRAVIEFIQGLSGGKGKTGLGPDPGEYGWAGDFFPYGLPPEGGYPTRGGAAGGEGRTPLDLSWRGLRDFGEGKMSPFWEIKKHLGEGNDEMRGFTELLEDPALANFTDELETMGSTATGVIGGMSSIFGSFFASMVSQGFSFGSAMKGMFSDLASHAIGQIGRMAAAWAITGLFNMITGGIGGGIGGILGGGGSSLIGPPVPSHYGSLGAGGGAGTLGAGGGATIINISTLDSKSLRHAARSGSLRRELRKAGFR